LKFLPAIISAAALIWVPPVPAQDAAPDAIFHGGKIVAVDPGFSIHEAFAIRGGRIVATGRTADLRLLARPGLTTLHDLAGRMVLPGLIDSHVHASSAAVFEFDHPIPPMESIADVLAYIAGRAKVVPGGQWIKLQQVFITRLREGRFPTRLELDRAAPDHPVVFRTGPDLMLNTRGMRESGFSRDFKVTDGGPGYMETDSTGEPTGLMRGLTRFLKTSLEIAASPADRERLLKTQFEDYNRIGITAVAQRDGDLPTLAIFQGLRDRGELTVRLAVSYSVPTVGPMEGILGVIDQVAALPQRREDPWLRVIGTKIHLDGGMLTGSAYMLKPWGRSTMYGIADDAYRGVLNVPPDRLYQMVDRVARHGMQFTAHSVGDGAVTELLAAYERVNREHPVRNLRLSLTHANFLTSEAITKAAALGVVLDVQPIWLYLDTRTLVQHFGYERLRYFQPLRSLFAAGAVAGGGSDHMLKIGDLRAINPYNPFLGIWTTITRGAKWYEGHLYPEEALTRQQAIQFYTRNNAHLLFWEKEIGSIEPGKRADFIVLDRDLLECPVDAIKETSVLQTWVEGRMVYSSGQNGRERSPVPAN
jgi:predicted amidohydrolase YtcJ